MDDIMAKTDGRPTESFVTGVVVVVFLVIAYQTAMFVHRAAVVKIAANRDAPDTVYVYGQSQVMQPHSSSDTEPSAQDIITVRKNANHSPLAAKLRDDIPRMSVETFRFNPNTVTEEDLCRLGFSVRQARSIINYRKKGGRFRRKSDFAKSYVVSDSIYLRLEPFIDIPLLDLNLADSADFDALPGIGGWFASKIIAHRKALGGYSYKEQLMDIWKLDSLKYDALSDLITVSDEYIKPYSLWSLPADSLCKHPYIGNYETARSIVLYRENTPRSSWSIKELSAAGILSEPAAERLMRCAIVMP